MRILSLGWGVQSFTIVAMVALGELEPVDYAVHVDTGYESSLTYAFAERWTGWLEERGVRVATLRQNNPIINKYGFVQIPSFTYSGQGKRQCTYDWKLIPIRRWIAQELKKCGLSKTPGIVEQMIGISTDEYHRANPSRVKYVKNIYPLIDLGMSRNDCKIWLLEHGLEMPPKSSCVICPYHSKAGWRAVKDNQQDWQKALIIDAMVRNHDGSFLHHTCKPLCEVDMRTQEEIGQMRLL